MTRPIQHDDHQILHAPSERLRNRAQIEPHRRVEIDDIARARTDDQLFHVHVWRMEQAAAFRRGEHGDGVRRAGGAEVRPFQRIDGDIHLRIAAPVRRLVRRADLLADVEHRRLVALAFADDDRAVDRHRVHHLAHCLDGDLIGLVPIALAHRVRARDRGLFDDAQEFERQI